MNRLRAYRAIEGITQDDLARKLGISGQLVSAIEGGRRTFNGTLEPLGYADARLDLPEMSEPLHRGRASMKVASRDRAQELLRLAGEVFSELRNRTQRAPASRLERVGVVATLDDIDDAASDIRAEIGHEARGPIKGLTSAVERAGVCLVPMAAIEGLDGLSSWVEGTPVIGVSPSMPGDRFRFTLAHEIAHLVLHSKKTANTEHEANRFASALLVPPAEFEAAMSERPQLKDFTTMKGHWGISVAALVYRAHETGVIDDQRFRALQIQMSRWRRNEPGEFPASNGNLLPQLVEVNGGVSTVARKLGINVSHLASLVTWTHLRAV